MAGLNDNGRGSYGGGGYNNNRSGYSNSYNGNRSSSGSYNSRSSYGQQKELPPEITPKKVPEDYLWLDNYSYFCGNIFYNNLLDL